jgi:hypothetical protein
VVVVASVWASGWGRFTWGARLGTAACAGLVLAAGLAWGRRYRADPDMDPGHPVAGDARWLALVGLAVAWDVLALLTPPGRPHLTLSATELAYRPLHALLFATWLALGWLLARTPLHRRRA